MNYTLFLSIFGIEIQIKKIESGYTYKQHVPMLYI